MEEEIKTKIKKLKRFCGSCKEEDTMLICMECRRKDLEKQRANIIRELKKNHPKGFCYICGKGKRTTIHHLRDIESKGKGKINEN
ncbi:hypothetical protein LCGC14_3104520 [marine sediment metagenome]|uniref:Uncharacterized protein n=1 Tax=marine sediment metagenome TaxID=412755 RepID=A0A0F8YEB4_9ZZZZ